MPLQGAGCTPTDRLIEKTSLLEFVFYVRSYIAQSVGRCADDTQSTGFFYPVIVLSVILISHNHNA
jgi:hypothetical protein